MNKLKRRIKIFLADLLWQITKLRSKFYNVKFVDSNGPILLIPPSSLDGSFGDELMVASFISNFAGNRPVTIFSKAYIKRDDFLGGFSNVTYDGNFKPLSYFYMFKILKKFSTVVMIGADVMDGTYGGKLGVMRNIRIIQLGLDMGLSAKFMGFSMSNKVIKPVIDGFKSLSGRIKLKARDKDSYDRLVNMVGNDNVLLTSDLAFACPDIPSTYSDKEYDKFISWSNESKLKNEIIIGFCPNSIQADRIGYDRYMSGIVALLDSFLKLGEFSFAFLYHDVRPLCADKSDVSISKDLYELYTSRNINCYFNSDVKNGLAVKGYLKSVDFTLTGRMHFGISGIYNQKPMFGVCYANKFEGMLKLFGIEPENCLVDYTKLRDSDNFPVVENFLNSLDGIRSKINKHLGEVKENALRNNM